jgi:hypothetical protein
VARQHLKLSKGMIMAEIFARQAVPLAFLAQVVLGGSFVGPVRAERDNDRRDHGWHGCEVLRVPAGHRLKLYSYAEGVQVYSWNGTSWVFQRPEAKLYATRWTRFVIGTHYAGPTWEIIDGSHVVGAVLERCTPDANAIPWLLLQGVDSDGPGILDGVSYIQRVNTEGGLAPSQPGSFVGEEARIPYTADYLFYRQRR